MTMASQLLTVDEAAEQLRTSVRFIRRLIEERRIVYVKLGSHVRIEQVELSAFIEANRIVPASRVVEMRRAA
jgi:excisionase family DNA binding protein